MRVIFSTALLKVPRVVEELCPISQSPYSTSWLLWLHCKLQRLFYPSVTHKSGSIITIIILLQNCAGASSLSSNLMLGIQITISIPSFMK